MSSVVEVLGRRKNVHLCVAGGGWGVVSAGVLKGQDHREPHKFPHVLQCLIQVPLLGLGWLPNHSLSLEFL